MKTKSELFLENRNTLPSVSALMASNVSQYRREVLASEVDHGLFKDGTRSIKNGITENSVVSSSYGINKYAQFSNNSTFNYRGTSGDTAIQVPEIYSPLWLNSNLSLPRDRATINAWCRSFYALNPFVHNAINLHSTYPISKLNIKCANKDIEKFFNDMIEEIDLMNICVQIAQEYWLLGESFVFAEFNEGLGKWNRLLIQNPDYMIVQRAIIADEPIIMLRPDENLKKIIFSSRPHDLEQKKQLNQHIIESVKRGQNITLDNFNVSHLARRISPYEIRGTGLPVCVFRQLMLMDKLRECYDEETEVLTDKGFKKITDLLHVTNNLNLNPNYVNGISLKLDNTIDGVIALNEEENFKIACYNSETDLLEYHKPTEFHMSKYTGDMIHFNSKMIDICVSPNHKMWNKNCDHNEWQKTCAKDIKYERRFKSIINFKGNEIECVDVLGKQVPIKLYLKFLGYVISEGCLTHTHLINFSQSIASDCFDDLQKTIISFAKIFDKEIKERYIDCSKFKSSKTFKKIPSPGWQANIYNTELNKYFSNQICSNNTKKACGKIIPRWVLDLDTKYLEILLSVLVAGDGSAKIKEHSNSYKYYTSSKELADNVQELVFKCGYSSNIYNRQRKHLPEYTVAWSSAQEGKYPYVLKNSINKINYDGIVWCFEVPTGLFVTRRNNKITIQGNSKFAQADGMVNPTTLVKIGSPDYKPTPADLESWREIFETAAANKDFKIFTHDAVTIERIGYGQGIYDISGDITQLIKEIYVGLQVPSVLMDGGQDTTYANGGVALDVLRQRYMQFRNMMASWLKRKIFAPVSKCQGFYEFVGGKKQLIIPEIDWNHMSLFDAGDYIDKLMTLTQGEGDQKRASLHSLYKSMGLEYEDEKRKKRKEAIQSAIEKKEKVALDTMGLGELRSLDEDDEILDIDEGKSPKKKENTVPGEVPPGESGMPDLGMGGPPPPSLELPPPPPPPPPPK